MLQVTTEAESWKVKSGRPHTLGLADQLLLTLSYLRHYHTQLELAAMYGLSESNVCRTIRKTEDALIRCKRFSLPKHRNLGDQTVIIDVAESPIERPKKNSGSITAARKSGIRLKSRSYTAEKLKKSSASRRGWVLSMTCV